MKIYQNKEITNTNIIVNNEELPLVIGYCNIWFGGKFINEKETLKIIKIKNIYSIINSQLTTLDKDKIVIVLKNKISCSAMSTLEHFFFKNIVSSNEFNDDEFLLKYIFDR